MTAKAKLLAFYISIFFIYKATHLKKYFITAALATSIFLTGCATTIKGTQDTVTINSLEKGTLIYVDGVKRGYDDAIAQVKRGKVHTIKVTKDGCEDLIIETGETFDSTSLLGIFIDFGLITIPVDMISGAAWKTSPTIYTVSPLCKQTK
ncbi:hypothetical protein EOPP23_17850 [Endozoicomonas sp. OPT23]|uniref:hypothetical protein n=1 Tax=Endozoicomonas sp. OPT23 TaxID=2072845 RepID=UPI00129A5E79|nr:hypothetical protein [Endozoicomonas sp. OPT23]MRI34844.1 hypothetical protein [Endozoicomonas sp. OPT23]